MTVMIIIGIYALIGVASFFLPLERHSYGTAFDDFFAAVIWAILWPVVVGAVLFRMWKERA